MSLTSSSSSSSSSSEMRELIKKFTGTESERADAIEKTIRLITASSSSSSYSTTTTNTKDNKESSPTSQFFLLKGMQSLTFALNASSLESKTCEKGCELMCVLSKKHKNRVKMNQFGSGNAANLLLRIARKSENIDGESYYYAIKSLANFSQELDSSHQHSSSLSSSFSNSHHHHHHQHHSAGGSLPSSSSSYAHGGNEFFPVTKESCLLMVNCLMSKRLECAEAAVMALIHICRAKTNVTGNANAGGGGGNFSFFNKKNTKLVLNQGVSEPLVTLLQRALLQSQQADGTTKTTHLLDYCAKLIVLLSGQSLKGRHLLRQARAIDALTKALLRFSPSDEATESLIWAIASLCNTSDKSSTYSSSASETMVLAIGAEAIEGVVKIAEAHSGASAIARHRATLTSYRLSSLLENKKYLQRHAKTTFATLCETFARESSNSSGTEHSATNKETSVLAFATIARIVDDKNYACELLKNDQLPIGKYIGTSVARWLGLRVVEKNDPARTLGVLDLLKLAAIIGRTAQTTKKTNPPSQAASAFCASGGAYVLCASLEPPEHDSDGENDSENGDGVNEYGQDDDDYYDDDFDDDGFGVRRSSQKKKHGSSDDEDTEHQSSAALVDACRALSGLSSHPAHHSALRAANVVEELRAMLQMATGRAGDPVPALAQMFAKECLQRLVGPNGTINTESASYDVDRFLTRSLSREEKPDKPSTTTTTTKKLATATSLNAPNKLPTSSSTTMMSESLLKTANSSNIDRMELGEHRINTQTMSLQQQKKRRRGSSRLFTRRRCIVLLCLTSVAVFTFSLAGRLTEAIGSLASVVSVGNF
jgi:hypothetical protein